MTTTRETRGTLGKNVASVFVLMLVLSVFTGCAHVGPDYVAPKPEAPDVWHQKLAEGLAGGKADLQTWWTVFDDPVLTRTYVLEREGARRVTHVNDAVGHRRNRGRGLGQVGIEVQVVVPRAWRRIRCRNDRHHARLETYRHGAGG